MKHNIQFIFKCQKQTRNRSFLLLPDQFHMIGRECTVVEVYIQQGKFVHIASSHHQFQAQELLVPQKSHTLVVRIMLSEDDAPI